MILKGILTAEDAREAVKHNVKGIIVSNHGGRQLDGVPATVSQLRILEKYLIPLLLLTVVFNTIRLMLSVRWWRLWRCMLMEE